MVENIDEVAAAKKHKNECCLAWLKYIQISSSRKRLKKELQAKGRSISGLTTKLHLAISSDFHIIEGFLTGGNRADIGLADELKADVYGCFVVEDKGYDSDEHRKNLELRGNIPVIPGRKNRKEPI